MHSAFGVSWMELLSCVVTARDTTMAVYAWRLCLGVILRTYHHSRYADRDFSRRRGLKGDIFIKTYLMVTFIY